MKNVFIFCFVMCCSTLWAQQNFDTVKIRAIKVVDNIYMLKGSGGNVGVMFGKDGTLMIDDEFAPLSNKINGAIKTLDPGDIRLLVNTHFHGDHTGGNENFKRMGSTVVAHFMVRERIMKESPFEKDALPVITFSSSMNFHLNDEDIELIHLDRGHTDGDVIVRFKNANVFHMGDAFVRYGYPYIDMANGGSCAGFISTLDKAMALMDDNTKVIPGHGELATKADVKVLRDKLADIRDQVFAALKKGKKVEEITSLGITDKYDSEMGKGFVKGKDFALMVAEELKASMPAKK